MLSLQFCLFALAAADFFVGPNGDDTADGTEASPFATLGRAQNAVQTVNKDMSSDLHVHIAQGTYYLDAPLYFTAQDSGSNGFRVVWQGDTGNAGVNVSGGIELDRWTVFDSDNGIWQASTPANVESRHFYVNQQHAQRARHALDREWLTNTAEGYQVVNDQAAFLLNTSGIETGEIRGINSFTDRYIPIQSVGSNQTLIMAQPAFQNNLIGYDTIIDPFADYGFFVENVFAFLDEENEYFLNSSNGTIFYQPPSGQDPNDMYTVLAKLEQLLILAGTYDDPVHDLQFEGLNYMHTTWNYPSGSVGYADQQTGGYIGLNTSYPTNEFESSRPFWWQVPGSVQASAAHNITFTNGSMVAIMGGFGIGNDADAHQSGVGLGAKDIEISGMFFTQTGTNCITIGGIKQDAHHPTDSQQVNEGNLVTENILTNTAITYTSGCGILVTYNNGTEISRNDLSNMPYSGICYGYGWGANDAGGNPVYQDRGTYNYQPVFDTPTPQMNGLIADNLVQTFGRMHTDLAGIYTLSASPNTNLTGNCVFNGAVSGSKGTAYYHDEGSRYYVDSESVVNVTGNSYGGATTLSWFQANLSPPGQTTGNITAFDIAVAAPLPLQIGTDSNNDTIYDITQFSSEQPLSSAYERILYNCGIPPSQRATRQGSPRPAA